MSDCESISLIARYTTGTGVIGYATVPCRRRIARLDGAKPPGAATTIAACEADMTKRTGSPPTEAELAGILAISIDKAVSK